MIKKKILIKGKKVHGVGYRPFLLAKARRLGIPNYDAENIVRDGQQTVMVSLAADEKKIQDFVDFTRKNYPPKAMVLEVVEATPPEKVLLIDEYDKILSAEQQNTIVQVGLGMQDKQGGMHDDMVSKFDTLRDDYGRISETMNSMDKTLKEVSENLTLLTKAILNLAEKTGK